MANEEKKTLSGFIRKKDPSKPANTGKSRFSGIAKWFREMISELKKVTWASRQDLINYTTVVIVFIIIMSAVVGVLDAAAGTIFQFLTQIGS